MAYSYSTNINYALRFRSFSVWGGFVSQNSLLKMKYCSIKENGILHTIKFNSYMENKFSI